MSIRRELDIEAIISQLGIDRRSFEAWLLDSLSKKTLTIPTSFNALRTSRLSLVNRYSTEKFADGTNQ